MVDNGYLMYCAEELGADEIVVPDILGDCEMTLMLARDFAPLAKSHRGFGYMGVVQGKDAMESIKCLNGLMSLGYITTIALPRRMFEISRTERYIFAAHMADELGYDLPIHCLGSSAWLREVALLSECAQIRGIDTSMPINEALFNIDIATSTKYESRADDFFDKHIPFEMEYRALENVRTFLGWAAYETPS
jgi:hypothetical protein